MGIIPIYPVSPKSHPTTLPASVSAPQDTMPVRTQPCVLVVEDETDLRELIVEALTKDGFAVAQAPTGADALERLQGLPTTRWSSTSGCPTPTAWTSSTRRWPATPRSARSS